MTSRIINVLDKGFVRLVESYGSGDARIAEAGIIEAARQSTQGAFRGWSIWHCSTCGQNFEEKTEHTYNSDMPGIRIVGAICEKPVWSNDEKLLRFLYTNTPPHSTPFEFAGMIIEVKLPIFVTREWHRHRTQSYNEMSARYAPLPDDNYQPTKQRLFLTQEKNKQAQSASGAMTLTSNLSESWLASLETLYRDAETVYQAGLKLGVPKEVARVVLPVGRYTQMRASANLLNWLKFLTLRMDENAQWEIRQYANAVATLVKQEFPRTWELFEEVRSR